MYAEKNQQQVGAMWLNVRRSYSYHREAFQLHSVLICFIPQEFAMITISNS